MVFLVEGKKNIWHEFTSLFVCVPPSQSHRTTVSGQCSIETDKQDYEVPVDVKHSIQFKQDWPLILLFFFLRSRIMETPANHNAVKYLKRTTFIKASFSDLSVFEVSRLS